MKWIKASERLPDSKDCSTGIIVKYKGHKYRAYFHQDNNQFDVTYVNVTLTFGKNNYGDIEWLDDTPQSEGDNDVIKVAEKLYYEANPTTKMDVPSYAYEQVERANHRRCDAKSELSLYDWCKTELDKSNTKAAPQSEGDKKYTREDMMKCWLDARDYDYRNISFLDYYQKILK